MLLSIETKTNFSHASTTSSGQFLSPPKWPIKSWLAWRVTFNYCFLSSVQDLCYLATTNPLDEMLNFVKSSFFLLNAF